MPIRDPRLVGAARGHPYESAQEIDESVNEDITSRPDAWLCRLDFSFSLPRFCACSRLSSAVFQFATHSEILDWPDETPLEFPPVAEQRCPATI